MQDPTLEEEQSDCEEVALPTSPCFPPSRFTPFLIVSSPSVAEECLTKNDIVFANRPQLIAGKYIGYNYTSLIWANYGDHWRNLRRISTLEILSSSCIQMLSGIRADEVRLLVLWLLEHENQTVNMKAMLFEITTNVMMRMIAGRGIMAGAWRSGGEETVKFREIMADTIRLGDMSNIGDYLPMLRWLGVKGKEEGLRELQRKRDRFMQSLIEEHRTRIAKDKESSSSCCNGDDGEKKKKKTMIEVMLSLQEKEPDYYTDLIIRGLMLALLGAGTDTTATTIEWTLSLLLNNPHALKKAQMEIDNHLGDNHLIQESDLNQLPYLHCIIKESQRMHPVGPIIPHESSGECTVGGYRIPHGTMLLVNVWAIQNDSRVWEEPRKFTPERFEGMELEKHGFRLMPFGSGRRGCPGEGLAVRMVGLVLGSLIQCFDWESVGEGMVDMSEGTGLSLPKAQPLLVRCRHRPALVDLLSKA
ncbi:Cytochrome P450 81D11 [Vitis vinifera]|uniref:Cytochrome P450 81D11 n=1 Tax=Vitis vinifera TaxID=29760 RepID=A0A438G680_VITVI|nr:Cytochrome P450 81D11 [Vitis vinifera]